MSDFYGGLLTLQEEKPCKGMCRALGIIQGSDNQLIRRSRSARQKYTYKPQHCVISPD